MVLRLEEAEPPATLREIVDVPRQGLDEAVDLVDQLRDKRRPDARQHREHEQVGGGDRRPSPQPSAALDEADERIERQREEQRDHDPGEDAAGQPDQLDEDAHADCEREHAKNRARAEIYDTFGRHRVSMACASDANRGFLLPRVKGRAVVTMLDGRLPSLTSFGEASDGALYAVTSDGNLYELR